MADQNLRRTALDTVGMGNYAGVDGSGSEPGESVDEHLVSTLRSHIAAETGSLRAYAALAEATADPLIKEILGIVIEEEDRHHKTLEKLSATWEDDLNWTHNPQAFHTQRVSPEQRASFIEDVKRFIKEEEDGIKDFQAAAKDARKGKRAMSAMMLEWMAMDGKKHVQGLQYILKRLESRR